MIDDLRHYRRKTDLGAFQVISRDVAFALLIALGVFCLLFAPELVNGIAK